MLNPELARVLLAKLTPQNQGSVTSAVVGQLARLVAVRGAHTAVAVQRLGQLQYSAQQNALSSLAGAGGGALRRCSATRCRLWQLGGSLAPVVRVDMTEPVGPIPTLGVQRVLGDRSLPTLPVRPHLRVDTGRATPEALDCPMFSRVDGIYPIYVGHIKTGVALAAGEA